MKVVNLWAGPGAGKSTTAAGLFYLMKVRGHNVELVTEYAKDMTWEGRHNILDDQVYIAAKQNRRLLRLTDHDMELAITDSPLLLGLTYAPPGYLYGTLEPLLMELWRQYDNINYLIKRTTPYDPVGRNQDASGADEIDQQLVRYLTTRKLDYTEIDANTDAIEKIYTDLQERNIIS